MKRFLLFTCLGLCVTLCGCWPKRIAWSPDGSRAVVLTKNSVAVCDQDGTLIGKPCEIDEVSEPSGAQWFPDGRYFLLVSRKEMKRWEDVESLIGEEEKTKLLASTEQFRDEILQSTENDLGKIKSVAGRENNEIAIMKMYLREHDDGKLARRLGDTWKEFENASHPVDAIEVFESTDDGPTPRRILARSIRQIMNIRLSQSGKAVAFTTARNNDFLKEGLDLFVQTTAEDGGKARRVAELTSWEPDWSADGEFLVYAKGRVPKEDAQLGTITRRKVCDAEGTLLEEFPNAEELAGVLFGPLWTKVRCLKDGGILFSAFEVQLPVAMNDMPKRPSLFVLDPNRRATVARVLPRSAEIETPELVNLFEPSPNGRKVSIPGERGRVAVLDLVSGAIEIAQPQEGKEDGNDWLCKKGTVPIWRTDEELSFVVPAGSKDGSPERTEFVLWSSKKGSRCISRHWGNKIFAP